jgi:hypothetical protein
MTRAIIQPMCGDYQFCHSAKAGTTTDTQAPTCASFEYRWWQSDIGWAFIRLAGRLGLASNIKQHQGQALPNGGNTA